MDFFSHKTNRIELAQFRIGPVQWSFGAHSTLKDVMFEKGRRRCLISAAVVEQSQKTTRLVAKVECKPPSDPLAPKPRLVTVRDSLLGPT